MSGLRDFIGQSVLKELVCQKIMFARSTGTALPHMLLCGDSAQGKMTFAAMIADDAGVQFSAVPAESIVKILDLTSLLSNVRLHQVLAISDVDGLRSPVLEALTEAISTF